MCGYESSCTASCMASCMASCVVSCTVRNFQKYNFQFRIRIQKLIFISFIFSPESSETSHYTQKQKLYKTIYKIIYIRVKQKSHVPGSNSWRLEIIANPKATEIPKPWSWRNQCQLPTTKVAGLRLFRKMKQKRIVSFFRVSHLLVRCVSRNMRCVSRNNYHLQPKKKKGS